jgi:hypothetical protein
MGLLFDLHWGLQIGLFISLFIFLILSVWGEKFILIFARARYVTDDEILINQVKNFCCHCEVPDVKVYWSSLFVNNLYYVDSYFGKPTLVIGKNVYKTLSRNELNSLIYASLLKLKTNEAKHRTMASLIFFVLYLPVYFFRAFVKNIYMLNVANFFLYPPSFLKAKLYEKKAEVFGFDQQVAKLEGLKKDYISALFKVNHLLATNELSIGSGLLNDLNHVKNQTADVLNFLLIESVSVEERAKQLK